MLKAFARFFLKLRGWEMDGEVPTAQNYVLIAARHTSNWDLVYMLAFSKLVNANVRGMGKHPENSDQIRLREEDAGSLAI
jgi:1-acyl-sn-glycerol-3-phosphate acyltransferase